MVFLTTARKLLASCLNNIQTVSFKSQFSHKQLVLVNGPCFYRVLSFVQTSGNLLKTNIPKQYLCQLVRKFA